MLSQILTDLNIKLRMNIMPIWPDAQDDTKICFSLLETKVAICSTLPTFQSCEETLLIVWYQIYVNVLCHWRRYWTRFYKVVICFPWARMSISTTFHDPSSGKHFSACDIDSGVGPSWKVGRLNSERLPSPAFPSPPLSLPLPLLFPSLPPPFSPLPLEVGPFKSS